MNRWIWMLIFIWVSMKTQAQEKEWVMMQEDQASVVDGQETDGEMEHLEFWRKQKISLNEVRTDELMIFPFLSAYQAEQLIMYRRYLGSLIDLLELQAVPGWDELTIRKILPYVSVDEKGQFQKAVWKSLKQGLRQVVVRSSLKQGSGLLARYQYKSTYLQWGIQIEKDAGEKLWQGKKGISFLSGQVSLNKVGICRQIVIGDFSISLGQGLVLGLGRSVHKSGMTMMIKRQQPFLMPYRSSDENRFFRGAGVWLGQSNWELGGFISMNRLDGNFVSDSLYGDYISSLQTSGIHQTEAELFDKNILGHRSMGVMASLQIRSIRIGVHRVDHFFSLPILKSPLLYNKYASSGKRNSGTGVKLETSFRNMHVFGELSRDHEGETAFIGGLQLAADRQLDLSILGRSISKAYKTFWGSAFTESTEPGDEKAVYLGLSFKPLPVVQVDGYIDWYKSDWLKYQINGPVTGFDQLLTLTVKPDKITHIYYRYHRERKTDGLSTTQPISITGDRLSVGGRLHVERKLGEHWVWRSRVEWTRLHNLIGDLKRGTLVYSEWFWKNSNKPYSLSGRIMFCDTDDYASRIYAYENDVLYYGLIPSFYGKYMRIYGNGQFELSEKVSFQIKASINMQEGLQKTSIRLQWVYRN